MWRIARGHALNSAYILDGACTACLTLFQDIGPPVNVRI